jgi:hypothetical protein
MYKTDPAAKTEKAFQACDLIAKSHVLHKEKVEIFGMARKDMDYT